MANFMRQDRFQLCVTELRNEYVEEDDFSETPEAGKESIGVARAFAAIHHLDAACGKIYAPRQCKEPLAQRSFWQRCKLVEKRHDDGGRDQQHEQLKRDDNPS